MHPSWLVDVISVTPAMRPNCLSSGVATDEAIVSGLAPGSPAFTCNGGKLDFRQWSDRKKGISDRPSQ